MCCRTHQDLSAQSPVLPLSCACSLLPHLKRVSCAPSLSPFSSLSPQRADPLWAQGACVRLCCSFKLEQQRRWWGEKNVYVFLRNKKKKQGREELKWYSIKQTIDAQIYKYMWQRMPFLDGTLLSAHWHFFDCFPSAFPLSHLFFFIYVLLSAVISLGILVSPLP